MRVILSFTEQQYSLVRKHLFTSKKEQGCFLFVTSDMDTSLILLNVKDVHLIGASGWSYQSGFHLELDEQEKVKVMLEARKYNCDLVECHSHCFSGLATFSPSDVHGLDEFVQYIWWKLPGKIYGAIVFTKSDVWGQIWRPKETAYIPISEIRVVDSRGNFKRVGKAFVKKSLFNIFKRWNND